MSGGTTAFTIGSTAVTLGDIGAVASLAGAAIGAVGQSNKAKLLRTPLNIMLPLLPQMQPLPNKAQLMPVLPELHKPSKHR